MEQSEEILEELKVAVNGGREYLEQSGTLPLEYITDIVYPLLQNMLRDLCLRIKERHKVDDSGNEEHKFVIHYTSISALVSMLRDASEEPKREAKKSESEPMTSDKKSSWRLYDSVHLNDPEEGNLLIQNLPKKYNWLLGNREESHAYIASFMSDTISKRDDLAFWSVYGKEGNGCSLWLRVPRSRLQKVRYGTREVNDTVKVLKSVLDSLEPLVRIRKSPIRERVREVLSGVVWEYLEKIRYLYKSDAYKHESECRFVIAESDIPDKKKIRFEDQDRKDYPECIKHYYEPEDVELGIENMLVTESLITLGPCVSHPYNVEYYLKTLMRRANLEGPKVERSNISYRKP